VKKSPPTPPTIGPTYLSQVERGRYNSDGKYWPARVRVKGAVKIKPNNPFQFGLLSDHAKEPPPPVDFLVEARLTKDDFGNWRVSYHYDPQGPRWRLGEPESPPSHQQMRHAQEPPFCAHPWLTPRTSTKRASVETLYNSVSFYELDGRGERI
jgi:hypothetical protein